MALVFILLCLCSNTIQCSHLILPHVFPALGHMNDLNVPYKHLIPSSEKVSILHLPGMRIFRLFKSVKKKYQIVSKSPDTQGLKVTSRCPLLCFSRGSCNLLLGLAGTELHLLSIYTHVGLGIMHLGSLAGRAESNTSPTFLVNIVG